MHYLSVNEVLELHRALIESSGGSLGVRDAGGLDSAVAQPQAAFGGVELYSTIAEKAGALAYSLIKNHAFVDGNKRIGYAAMAVFVKLNGYRFAVEVDDAQRIVLGVADGSVDRASFCQWIANSLVEVDP